MATTETPYEQGYRAFLDGIWLEAEPLRQPDDPKVFDGGWTAGWMAAYWDNAPLTNE